MGLPEFLTEAIEPAQLAAWSGLLPAHYRIVASNLFADAFVADEAGAIHMLEVAAHQCTPIAASEQELRARLRDDEDGWLLRPLVERCRDAGLNPEPGQCYAFTTLPTLGGAYEPENIWICGVVEWLGFTASIYDQIKNLPDGVGVRIVIVD